MLEILLNVLEISHHTQYNVSMIIKKGTTVYPSKLGQYNFHYPQLESPLELTMDIEGRSLSWVSHSSELHPLEVVSPKGYLPYTVLWVRTPV